MELLDELDVDSHELIEALLLLFVLLLVLLVVCMLCCLLKRRMEEHKKKEEKVEEASSFFSFHQAVPPQSASKSSALFPAVPSAFFKSSVSSLPADDRSRSDQQYVRGSETTAAQQGNRTGSVDVGEGGASQNTPPLLLGSNQHVTTPIFPPSYFASAPYGPLSSAEPYRASSPPPLYSK